MSRKITAGSRLISVPNCLTALRAAGAVILLFTKLFSAEFYFVYTICGITDVLDGWIARKTNTESELGARLDSIADLIFYAVMLIRISPVLWEKLPAVIWYAVSAILALRIASYAVAAVKYRCFASLHTWLNKVTGAAVFAIPYLIMLPEVILLCAAVCAIAAAASVEELLIHICRKEYHPDVKTILEEKPYGK